MIRDGGGAGRFMVLPAEDLALPAQDADTWPRSSRRI
jgi:hypothetical protein